MRLALEESNTLEPHTVQNEIVKNFLRVLSLHDSDTEEHARRVTELTINLAKQIGVPNAELQSMWSGAMLHDIGKLAIPESILRKSESLTSEDWEIIRMHPWVGAEIIKNTPNLECSIEIPLHHHEKWDGSGYPDQLAGEQIPLSARIFAFADVYDALTSERAYRSAWKQSEALDYIYEHTGTHFDPFIMPMFKKFYSN